MWRENDHPLTPLEEHHRRLAESTEGVTPGPELAALLHSIDIKRLNGHYLVTLIRAHSRQVAFSQAQMFAAISEMAHCPPDDARSRPNRSQEVDEYAADELRPALRWTHSAAESQMQLALTLTERLPVVWEALNDGRLDLPRARRILDGTSHLDVVIAREVAERVLVRAPELTTGQISSWLRKLCIDADPDDAEKRYERGVEEREVVSQPNPDGTGDLHAFNLPGDRVAAIMGRINQLARNLRTKGENRTLDQLRADVLMDMLEGKRFSGSGRRSVVDIRIDLPTLIGLADRAAEIPGWGPVISDIARKAVERQPDGEWRVTVTDADTGNVLWNGATRRRPSAGQRRHVEAVRPTCVGPGCRNPARECDIDHTRGVENGGPTLVRYLGPACRHDHQLKTKGGWELRQPQPGLWVWTSRHGHIYQTVQPP